MRARRFFLSSLLILSSCPIVSSQQSPTTVTRDPQAISVLNQLATATGWGPSPLPADAVILATATENVDQVQRQISVTIKVKGCREFRIDANDANGSRSTVVNGDLAVNMTSSGSRAVPAHSVLTKRPLVLPFFCGLSLPLNASVSLQYLGTEDIAGQTTQKVQAWQVASPDDPWGTSREKASRLTIWVSATTGLPIQLASNRVSDDNPSASITTIRTLSDYRIVSGMAVPFHQEEWVGGRLLYSLQIISVTFNNGLSEADFTLPVVQP